MWRRWPCERNGSSAQACLGECMRSERDGRNRRRRAKVAHDVARRARRQRGCRVRPTCFTCADTRKRQASRSTIVSACMKGTRTDAAGMASGVTHHWQGLEDFPGRLPEPLPLRLQPQLPSQRSPGARAAPLQPPTPWLATCVAPGTRPCTCSCYLTSG